MADFLKEYLEALLWVFDGGTRASGKELYELLAVVTVLFVPVAGVLLGGFALFYF